MVGRKRRIRENDAERLRHRFQGFRQIRRHIFDRHALAHRYPTPPRTFAPNFSRKIPREIIRRALPSKLRPIREENRRDGGRGAPTPPRFHAPAQLPTTPRTRRNSIRRLLPAVVPLPAKRVFYISNIKIRNFDSTPPPQPKIPSIRDVISGRLTSGSRIEIRAYRTLRDGASPKIRVSTTLSQRNFTNLNRCIFRGNQMPPNITIG